MPHKYGSNIPEARRQLRDIAKNLEATDPTAAAEITTVVNDLMIRNPAVRTTPVRQGPPTADQIRKVKVLARTTRLSQQEIGIQTNLNAGRVSEILNGHFDE